MKSDLPGSLEIEGTHTAHHPSGVGAFAEFEDLKIISKMDTDKHGYT